MKEHEIKTISATEYTKIQTFTFPGKQYILDDESHLQNIYNIIVNFNDLVTQQTVLKKQRSLSTILKELPEEVHSFQHPVL